MAKCQALAESRLKESIGLIECRSDGGRVHPRRPEWLDAHARPRLAARLAELLDGLVGAARGGES